MSLKSLHTLRKCTHPTSFKRYFGISQPHKSKITILDPLVINQLIQERIPQKETSSSPSDVEYRINPNTIQLKCPTLSVPLIQYMLQDFEIKITPFFKPPKRRIHATFNNLQSLQNGVNFIKQNQYFLPELSISILSMDPVYKLTDDEINQLPYGQFAGKLHIVSKQSEVAPAIKDLLEGAHPKEIHRKFSLLLGMDSEWRPNYKPGTDNRTSVLQLATEHTVVLFRPHLLGSIAGDLKLLLENPHITKVGVGLLEDGKKLAKDWGITTAGLEDTISKYKHVTRFKPGGLAGFTSIFCGFKLDKSPIVVRSNWEAKELSERQIRYAALDAWASRFVHMKLKELPTPKDPILFPFDPKHFPPISSTSLIYKTTPN